MRKGKGIASCMCAAYLMLVFSLMPARAEAVRAEPVPGDETVVAEPMPNTSLVSENISMYSFPASAHIKANYGLDSIILSATYENNSDGGQYFCAWMAPHVDTTKPILVMLPEAYVGAQSIGPEVSSGDVKEVVARYTGNPVKRQSSCVLDKTNHVYSVTTGFTSSSYRFGTWMALKFSDGSYDTDNADNKTPGMITIYDPIVYSATWVDSSSSDMYRVDKEHSKVLYPYGLTWNALGYPIATYDRYAHYQVKSLSGRTATEVVKLPAVGQFKVTYHANGEGVSNMPSPSGTKWFYQTENITYTEPTRSGYTFGGWYTEPDGGTRYEAGQSVTGRAIDLDLYAHWESDVTDEKPPAPGTIQVRVPTTIACTLLGDGTVVVPSGLSIKNSGDAVVVDAYTADAMGNAVDFTLDIGGARALSRAGGKDVAPARGIDLNSGTTGALALSVSKLNRQSNGNLMDSATTGAVGMVRLGFKFNLKEIQGKVSIEGGTSVGSMMTAKVSGAQEDVVPGYQWYRVGENRESLVSEYIPMFGEVEREFTCGDNAALTFSIMDSNYVRNDVTVTVLDAESGQTVYSKTMVSNGSSETGFLPRAGRYRLRISNNDPMEHYLDAYVDSKSPMEIVGATGSTYVTTGEDDGKQLFCKVSDASGRYTGTLTSNKILPTRENPKEASNE